MVPVSGTQTRPLSPIDNSRFGLILVAVALAAVTAAVAFLWLQVTPPPLTSAEHYFPAVHGAALSYRITNPDGSVTYRSRNILRDRAMQLMRTLPLDPLSAAFEAVELESAEEAVARLDREQAIRIDDTESDAQGNALSRTSGFSLLINNGIQQFAVNDLGIVPPIPLLPLSDAPQTVEGMVNRTIPFRATQRVESRGRYRTALGEFPDCIQVTGELVINETATTNRTWYCAGVGEVADEFTDANGTRRTEIVAASVGTLVLGSTPVIPDRNLNASIQRVFEQPLQGAPERVFEHNEDSSSRGITTNILPLDDTLLYGTASGAVVRLDRATGDPIWRFQTGDAVFSTPIVSDGLVFFGSTDKKAYALRAGDGAFVWSYPTRDVISATPAVSGGNVYIASEDQHLYALDADTGKLRWDFTSGGAFVSPPVVVGDTLYVSNDDGGLYALDANTGSVRWVFSAGRAVTAPVTPVDSILYFGSYDSKVFAVDRLTGDLLWSQDVDNPVKQPVLVSNGRIYVTLDQEVFALDAETGNPIWFYDNQVILNGAPVLMGNQLWLAKLGALFALDVNTGTVISETATTDASTYAGVSGNGRGLYLGSFDGRVLGFAGAAE